MCEKCIGILKDNTETSKDDLERFIIIFNQQLPVTKKTISKNKLLYFRFMFYYLIIKGRITRMLYNIYFYLKKITHFIR